MEVTIIKGSTVHPVQIRCPECLLPFTTTKEDLARAKPVIASAVTDEHNKECPHCGARLKITI